MRKLNRLSLMSLLAFAVALSPAMAQDKPAASRREPNLPGTAVERGRYIVENVAMCELCHTPRDCNRQSRQGPLAGGRSHAIAARVSIAILDADRTADCRPAARHRCRFHQAVDHRNRTHRHASQSADAAVSHDARGCRSGARLFEIAAQVVWNSSPWRGGRSARPSRSPN